jgi:hypothetical protein
VIGKKLDVGFHPDCRFFSGIPIQYRFMGILASIVLVQIPASQACRPFGEKIWFSTIQSGIG